VSAHRAPRRYQRSHACQQSERAGDQRNQRKTVSVLFAAIGIGGLLRPGCRVSGENPEVGSGAASPWVLTTSTGTADSEVA
jgi:hypothetical protein